MFQAIVSGTLGLVAALAAVLAASPAEAGPMGRGFGAFGVRSGGMYAGNFGLRIAPPVRVVTGRSHATGYLAGGRRLPSDVTKQDQLQVNQPVTVLQRAQQ